MSVKKKSELPPGLYPLVIWINGQAHVSGVLAKWIVEGHPPTDCGVLRDRPRA